MRKILRSSELLNKPELMALQKWRAAKAGRPSGRRRRRVSDDLSVPAANLFFSFFPLQSIGEVGAGGADNSAAVDGDVSIGGSVDTQEDGGAEPIIGDDAPGVVGEPESVSKSQWHMRKCPCAPSYASFPKDRFMSWAAVKYFFLAILGDPVVGMVQGVAPGELLQLCSALQNDDANAWHIHSGAANCVGLVGNSLARMAEHLEANGTMRKAVGRLLEFVVRLEDVVDERFKAVAKDAAEKDTGLNEAYCNRWGGVPTAAEFKTFAASEPAFAGQDLDSVYSCFE